MTEELLKFTKIWFLVCGIMQFAFGTLFTFFWPFFSNMIHFAWTDPALPYVFGTAAYGYSALSLLSFIIGKQWNAVKIPALAQIIWCFVSIIAMLYMQYGPIALHPINWINTLSYAMFMIGFIVAFILQSKK
jgi:uncharacterized membrane protein HdeD (DUF308 family)